ncbi:hypothetical protein HHK36_024754 [Tetracentron sinense]|uniref:ABC transporter domain-containing protein n=1 Tax=Tetracentron sinense TaxID=13715 RepID=A0A835D7S6_TETSI|nr:hypothetical protein HHK36_024754 [Tetracentron sinense]
MISSYLQKRNLKTNVGLIAFPMLLCLLLVLIEGWVNSVLDTPRNKCGCTCIDISGNGTCESVCGIQYSTLIQAGYCPITRPQEWLPLLQVPAPEYRAVRTDFLPFTDLPDESCKMTESCPVTVLLTGNNQSFGASMAGNLLNGDFSSNSSDTENDFSSNSSDTENVLANGSETITQASNFMEPAFYSHLPIYSIRSQCTPNSTVSVPMQLVSNTVEQGDCAFNYLPECAVHRLDCHMSLVLSLSLYLPFLSSFLLFWTCFDNRLSNHTLLFLELNLEVRCLQSLNLWRNSSSEINDELFKGYRHGNPERKINEIIADENGLNVSIWYNSTYKNDTDISIIGLVRAPRSVNLASNAYLNFLQGSGLKMVFEFVKEMPKPETQLRLDFSSLLVSLFFTWIVLLLFPVILTSLVYEKQQNLRIMMKMYGLGDGPYWIISYAYFLFISSLYMLSCVIFGSLIVTGYICVFISGLSGLSLFQFLVEDISFPRRWLVVMEIFPDFALYRGIYEFAQYSFMGNYIGVDGMRWKDLNDSQNGMREVLIIMAVEWLIVLLVAFYLDQVVSLGSGVRKHPLFFLQKSQKKSLLSFRRPSQRRHGSKVHVQIEKADVAQERENVEHLLLERSTSHTIICENLKKIYPGKDGNPEKFAVRGLSLAIPRGECFGMLGPNGAGKTSFISMMIGLTTPTSGMAIVQGSDIRTDMNQIYTSMGVCLQHDLLWETLTGREHLLFYGRLKNLKGSGLIQAVEESLKSVNLFHGGVGDKQAGKYSGGMKRRLSVAISLIGDPKVVYMDEPSTGLDPASRNNLWDVVKRAKQDRAIILTTHSMEEAEVLCDRLGIFVDGSLQCIGNPKELKGRYGGSYVFTMTTSSSEEAEVENLVLRLSPSANKIYHISGTQKFELPKQEVRIADVFQAVETAKSKFKVHAWGLADTTLEDVFIKVATGATGARHSTCCPDHSIMIETLPQWTNQLPKHQKNSQR